MRATGPGTVFLLGAGASKNAGLPLASEMTGMVLEHFNTEGSIPRYGPTLNFVVSAMIAHAGRSGRRPDQLPDIESVVSAIDLLSQRTDLELTPFVQSWDPGVTSVNSSTPYYFMSNIGRSFRNAVDAKHASAAEHEMRSIFNALFREKVGREASEATYRDLNEELMRWLVPNLAVSGDSGHLDYLTPLLALARGWVVSPSPRSTTTSQWKRLPHVRGSRSRPVWTTGKR